MARPKGSKNKPKAINQIYLKKDNERLNKLISKQDEIVAQAQDQISELQGQVEFYRKQVNHLLALANILAKGA